MSHTTQQHPPNALSHSQCGESYTGLGCFPLGQHLKHTEISDLLSTLRRLRSHKMLCPISPSALQNVKTQLDPLHAAQAFWSHHSRDAQQARAVKELLDELDADLQGKLQGKLRVYVFADSKRLSSTAPQVWGLFELDVGQRTTIVYLSGKSVDRAGTLLHTFMASRRCNRLQCFLAEYVLADQAGRLTEEWELPERLQVDIDMLEREEVKELLERLESEGSLEAPVLMAKLRGYCEDVLERKKEPVWWVEETGPGWT